MSRAALWLWVGAIALILLSAGCGRSGGGASSNNSNGVHGMIATGSSQQPGGNPLVGATVVAYQAGTKPGADAIQLGSAVSDASGGFSVTFNPTPADGALVYFVANGGDAGSGSNSAISEVVVWGRYCNGTPGCNLPAVISINEVTTVATTAALQRFISFVPCSQLNGNTLKGSCLDIHGGVELNGHAAVLNGLIDVTAGRPSGFLTSQPTNSPVYNTMLKLNTLANVLAGCVDSDSPTSTGCSGLFSQLPWLSLANQDTLHAAFEIATSPGATFNPNLFNFATQHVVYTPTLAAAPSNWKVGGYTYAYVANEGLSNNISAYTFDPANGVLIPIGTFAAGESPWAVVTDPSGKFAFVTNFNDRTISGVTGTISVFTIDPASGALTPVSGSPYATINHPTALAVDPTGRFVYAVNNNSNNLSAFSIDPKTGALTPIAGQPFATGKIPFSVAITPNGKFAYVANSLSNNISIYSIDPTSGALSQITGSPINAGKEPSALVITPDGNFLYAANSISNSISIYRINGTTGALTETTGSPVTYGGLNNPFFMAVDPPGARLYVANQNGNNVSAYTITSSGFLSQKVNSPFGGGNVPTAITVDPTGRFVYLVNRVNFNATGSITAYTIDMSNSVTNGGLSPLVVAASPFADPNVPTALAVDPRGDFLYAADYGGGKGGKVSVYSLDPLTGLLSEINGSPYTTSNSPYRATHVGIEPQNRFVYVKNSSPGSVGSIEAYTVNLANGSLSDIGSEPTGVEEDLMAINPNLAAAALYAETSTAKTVQLGTFNINASGALNLKSSLPITTGSGFPTNSLAVDPSGTALYAADSINDVLRVYAIDPSSATLTGEASGSPYGVGGLAPLSVAVDPVNHFVYATSITLNPSKSNALWQFGFTPGSPQSLKLVGRQNCGSGPFSIAVATNGGGFVYVADNGSLVSEGTTVEGFASTLTPLSGSPYDTKALRPYSMTVDPTSRYLYAGTGFNPYSASDSLTGKIFGYNIGPTGNLSQISGLSSPYPTDLGPTWITFTP